MKHFILVCMVFIGTFICLCGWTIFFESFHNPWYFSYTMVGATQVIIEDSTMQAIQGFIAVTFLICGVQCLYRNFCDYSEEIKKARLSRAD